MNKKIKSIVENIKKKKIRLSTFEPLSKDFMKSMEDWLRIELNYSINAIEWNTLNRQEIVLIVEDGIAPGGGKTVVQMLEAMNYNKALLFIMELSKKKKIKEITQINILDIHKLIQNGITYNDTIKAENHNMLNDVEKWLNETDSDPLLVACDCCLKFIVKTPFVSGNGKVGMLLFNLILLISGYPLSFVSDEETDNYKQSIEKAVGHEDTNGYHEIVLKAVERSLDLYLDMLMGQVETKKVKEKLLKIGKIAKATGESVPTIRFWTHIGLLSVVHKAGTRYSYYNNSVISICKKIRQLQESKRYTLEEIKKLLGN